MKFFLILLTLNAISTNAMGNSDFPIITSLSAQEGESTLEMTCGSPDNGATLQCKFTQKSIRTSTVNQKEIEASFSSLSKKDKATLIKKTKKSCLSQDMVKMDTANLKTVEGRNQTIKKTLCECLQKKESEDCLLTAMLSSEELKSKTCRIGTNSFDFDFKQISKNKWMNSPTPSALCNVVTAITLERKSKYNWLYTQTRLSSDTDNPLCVLDVNKPVIYDSSISSVFPASCEFIDLGISI